MSQDTLEQARNYLLEFDGRYERKDPAAIATDRLLNAAQAAALIAIAKRMDTQNEHLEYLRGHLNVAASAQTAIAEQAKRIADALNSIDGVLVNASGAGGAIKIDDGIKR